MELEMTIVNAFTDKQFKGNSAAVIILEDWLDEALMQNIATQNNLSETAFLKRTLQGQYDIRWFSPITEIDFCGHATLASAFTLFEYGNEKGRVDLNTQKKGRFKVTQSHDSLIVMDFPNTCPKPLLTIPESLQKGLSKKPVSVLKNDQAYFCIYDTQQDIEGMTYNSNELKKLAPLDVVITALGDECDFVSRYFWPANGGDEDFVTGSIHTGLAPYWANILNKNTLTAKQLSSRVGTLYCKVKGERVEISGYAKLYSKSHIFLA